MLVIEYKSKHIEAVKAFNKRLKKNGAHFQFPEYTISPDLPKIKGSKIFKKYYLVLDNDGYVRGGYVLKFQDFYFNGKLKTFAALQFPLSEGIINNNYKNISLFIFKDAFSRSKNLFTLGMGGLDNTFPKILKAFGWKLKLVPFHFKIINTKNFIRNIEYIKNNYFIKMFLNIFYYLGLIHFSLMLYNILFYNVRKIETTFEKINKFDSWADDIWNNRKNNIILLADRSCKSLNVLYPPDKDKFIKLKVYFRGDIIGWVVLLATRMKNHKQFGNMFLGSIIDCLCIDGFEDDIIDCSINYLKRKNVDLIVTNQSNKLMCDSLLRNKFISGPSNFGLALSKNVFSKMISLNTDFHDAYFNRGDGDGPINL